MHELRKSDNSVVSKKSVNKVEATVAKTAEQTEKRELAKGKPIQCSSFRVQSQQEVQQALERIRQKAQQERGIQFTNLFYHVYKVERLLQAYFGLKHQANPGIDSVTWKEYGEALESNLKDLADRLYRGAYHAKPSKRAYIAKANGDLRPLGIASLEDKIVQAAAVEVLNAIYEVEFKGFSYGFRPGRNCHQALDALAIGSQQKKVNYILDCDIKGFFDNINHDWLMKFVNHRIADTRMLRHIKKWLNAGVMEKGVLTRSVKGTPQGAVISPLLANIYLHYVLDVWVHHWRKHKAHGEIIMVRYADDFVMGFQYREDAARFMQELQERLQKFSLEIHPEKTRLIQFGRFAVENRKQREEGKPETFDFLGFTHSCDQTRKGKFIVLRQTIQKRLRAKLRAIKEWLRKHLHDPIENIGKYLRRVIQGYMNYFSVPRNGPAVRTFIREVGRLWFRALNRRSQKKSMTWKRMYKFLFKYFPIPKILHPYPKQRFDVMTQGKSRMR